jgi:hypothetical protein
MVWSRCGLTGTKQAAIPLPESTHHFKKASVLGRAHGNDHGEEGIVSFELARRQFLRGHPDEEGDSCEQVPALPDGNAVRWEDILEQP